MRVVIAEDSPLVRQILRSAVEGLGHECLAVADGLEAYHSFQEHGGDVIISDWSMPGLDGLELCRRIRSIPGDGHTSFILLTAYGGDENLLEAMRAGVDDFLTKPLDHVALEARLIAAERVTALHRERQAYTARLETLLRASRRFAFESHPSDLLVAVLQEAVDLLGADEGEIACWDEDQHAFTRIHRVAARVERPTLHALADTAHRPTGVTGVVSVDGVPNEQGAWTITASMLHGRQLLGAIRLLSSSADRSFEQADADVLELLAGVAAASLVGTERTRLEGVLLAGRTMNHELNNKLALAIGHIELIGHDSRLPVDLVAQAQIAVQAGQDASALLQQVNHLAHIREIEWGPFVGSTIDLTNSIRRGGAGRA